MVITQPFARLVVSVAEQKTQRCFITRNSVFTLLDCFFSGHGMFPGRLGGNNQPIFSYFIKFRRFLQPLDGHLTNTKDRSNQKCNSSKGVYYLFFQPLCKKKIKIIKFTFWAAHTASIYFFLYVLRLNLRYGFLHYILISLLVLCTPSHLTNRAIFH